MIELPLNAVTRGNPDSKEELPDEWTTVAPLTEDQSKIYRTKAVVIKLEDDLQLMTVRVEGMVPVFSGDKIIGCVTGISTQNENVVVDLAIDFATPERLELENGSPELWADGQFMITSTNDKWLVTSAILKRVNVVKTKLNYDIPPIGVL